MSDKDYDLLDRISSAINAALIAEDERRHLVEERDYYKQKYINLLDSSLRESQETTGMLIVAAIKQFTDASDENQGE